MVFFTCLLVVVILYYLQADALIYVTIIAVVGELLNIFMTQTVTKATEKKTATKFSKIVNTYKASIKAHKKTINELENIQEVSVKKIMAANKKIKAYEEKLKGGQNKEHQEGLTPLPEKEEMQEPREEQIPEIKKIRTCFFLGQVCQSGVCVSMPS